MDTLCYIILCQSIYKNVNIGCQINTNMKFDDIIMKFDDEAIHEIDGQDTISI